ncbi:MAG: flagellar biosynthetic protein FliO [Terriglobales bacterium]
MQITPIRFPLLAVEKVVAEKHAAEKPTAESLAGSALRRSMAVVRGSVEVLWRALVVRARRRPKSLVLVESSALGDRRFISVVQFEEQRFLVGSSPSSVTLLARLPKACASTGDITSAAEGDTR